MMGGGHVLDEEVDSLKWRRERAWVSLSLSVRGSQPAVANERDVTRKAKGGGWWAGGAWRCGGHLGGKEQVLTPSKEINTRPKKTRCWTSAIGPRSAVSELADRDLPCREGLGAFDGGFWRDVPPVVVELVLCIPGVPEKRETTKCRCLLSTNGSGWPCAALSEKSWLVRYSKPELEAGWLVTVGIDAQRGVRVCRVAQEVGAKEAALHTRRVRARPRALPKREREREQDPHDVRT